LITLGGTMLYQMKTKYNFEYRIQRNAIIAFIITEAASLVLFVLDDLYLQNIESFDKFVYVYYVSHIRSMV
jgi:hypothetical protein